MRQFSLRRFLNTLGGRLTGLAFFVSLVVLIGGSVVGFQLFRISRALMAMREASAHIEIALTAANQAAEVVIYTRDGVNRGLGSAELNRLIAPYLVTLESQRLVLRAEAERLPPENDLREAMEIVAIVLGNISQVSRQILRAVDQEDYIWAQYLLPQMDLNYRLASRTVEQMVVTARVRYNQAQAETVAAARGVLIIVPVVTVAVLLSMAGAATIVIRSAVAGVRLLSTSARRLAEGHLEERIPVRGLEEFRFLARTFNEMAAELQNLYTGLERLVAQRTAELARRTAQLEAAATVARHAAEVRDVETLLRETVRLISDRFGFYHAGIFLIDDAGEYAVLRAASSEGGQRMLARGHRLAVGKVGIVGYVAATGQPRIALDVGKDAVFFDNPDLPRTRSEMALPLKVGERVIGVLDVQSDQPAAFTEEDVAVLQTMADQIALAIENARLLEESRRALEELERLYGERTRDIWRSIAAARPMVYRYTGVDVEPLPISVSLGREEDGRMLAVPIRLWGQDIGSILLRRTEEQPPWSPEERR
ncbi:MAG: GAF domain-containing protein, partial [Anaerolineae bacterium]|nr:GAF domain-containing protein [Anaerolineae bacterium]